MGCEANALPSDEHRPWASKTWDVPPLWRAGHKQQSTLWVTVQTRLDPMVPENTVNCDFTQTVSTYSFLGHLVCKCIPKTLIHNIQILEHHTCRFLVQGKDTVHKVTLILSWVVLEGHIKSMHSGEVCFQMVDHCCNKVSKGVTESQDDQHTGNVQVLTLCNGDSCLLPVITLEMFVPRFSSVSVCTC